MKTYLLLICATLLFSGEATADQEETPSGITWEGSWSVGAALDEQGLPKDDAEPPAKSPACIRVGFSACWSFKLHWGSVEPKVEDESFDGAELSADEAKLIELTNAERIKLERPALKPDPVLMELARSHSASMAKLDQISHELEGKTFSQRLNEARYQAARAGENIAAGQRTPAETINSWMASPGHRENIQHPEYTRIGVAMATSKSGQSYWTQVFAKP